MGRSSRAAKGFVTSIFQYSAQILVQVLLAPVVLKVAGRETLGAYAAIMQVLGFIALVDIVGSWSLERFLGQAMGLDDGGERFRTILTTARTVFFFCNAAFALLVFIFSLFIGRLFHLSPEVTYQARMALYVIAVWAIARTPLAAYLNASIATQDLAAVNLIGTALGIVRAAASLGFVLMGGGLFGLMLAGTTAEACGYFLFRVRFKKMNPSLMPGWGFRDKKLLKEMLSFSGHAAFINIGNMLVYRSGNTIAGITTGAAAASGFYTTQMPTMTAYNMMRRFSDSATPAINELWGRGEVEKVRGALLRITRLLMTLTLPLAVGVILFNRDLVTTWVGPRQYAGFLLTASLAACCVIGSIQRVAIDYSFTFGWMRLLSVTSLLQGIANFGLAFFFAKLFGLGGITLALAIVIVPQTAILWYRLGRFLKVNALALYGECFLRALVPLSAAALVGWGLVHRFVRIREHAFLPLLTEMLAFSLVYFVLAYGFMLFQHDRDEIKRYVRNFVHRGKNASQKLFRFTES
ncbi:MAG: MATE family efflux transporter [Acidobacteriaceae bacterium]